MIVAIYARKSTDQHVTDEEKSVTRQVEHARSYADRKGWTVREDLVFVDDGISGAEFVKRPGFVRLMNALTKKGYVKVSKYDKDETIWLTASGAEAYKKGSK